MSRGAPPGSMPAGAQSGPGGAGTEPERLTVKVRAAEKRPPLSLTWRVGHSPSGIRARSAQICVTGDVGSGKTCLIRRYVNNYFPKQGANVPRKSVGLDYSLKLANVKEMGYIPVLLQLWDASDTSEPKVASPSKSNGDGGSYGYSASAASRDAVGCAFVADASSFNLHALAARKRQFDADVTYHNGENIPVVLFLNKLDTGAKLAKDDLDAFCAAHGFVAWFPCSAKTGENVEMAFSALTSHVMGCIDLWVHEDWTLESVFLKNCACA
jgi:GTPase SAR1 family protein